LTLSSYAAVDRLSPVPLLGSKITDHEPMLPPLMGARLSTKAMVLGKEAERLDMSFHLVVTH
jgi:hypothetical protein